MKPVDERTAARFVELALLVALLVFLGVAVVRWFRMLDRIDVSWIKGLPLAGVIVAAGWLTARRLRRVLVSRPAANDERSSERVDH